jgi:hypothetical protein
MNPLLEAALSYAVRGWPVLPLHSWTGRCTCGDAQCTSPAKHPRTAHGLLDATTDAAVIREWWTRWPGSNVGVRCDRLCVLDLDGPQAIDALRAHDLDPDLHPCTARTGAGRHLLFEAVPGGRPRTRVLPDVDVRAGEGSYIVAAPSVHWTGMVYEWVAQEAAPPSLPAAIRALLGFGEPSERSSNQSDPGASSEPKTNGRYDTVTAALEAARKQGLLGVSEGARHTTLAERIGQLVATGVLTLPQAVALSVLWGRTCTPAMAETEAARVGFDIWRREAAQHGGDAAFDYGTGGAGAGRAESVLAAAWREIDVARLLATQPDFQRWLLRHPTKDWRPCPRGEGDGMLERGVVGVLSAAGGSGKSMLALQLAVSVITGREWVGFHGPSLRERGRVCYLAGEDKPASLHRRLLAVADGLGLDGDERECVAQQLRLVSLAGKPWRLFEVDGQERLCAVTAFDDLRRLLGEEAGWAMVILDPAARLCGASIELDNEQSTTCVQHLERLSAEAGDAAVLLLGHTSKATRLAGQSHARGVSGLGDAARWHLGLVSDRLEWHKANDAIPWADRPVYLQRRGRLFVRGDGPTEVEDEGAIAAVLEVARRIGAQTNRDLLWRNAGLTQAVGRAAVRAALRRQDLVEVTRPAGPNRSSTPIVHASVGCHGADCAECARSHEEGEPAPPF